MKGNYMVTFKWKIYMVQGYSSNPLQILILVWEKEEFLVISVVIDLIYLEQKIYLAHKLSTNQLMLNTMTNTSFHIYINS